VLHQLLLISGCWRRTG